MDPSALAVLDKLSPIIDRLGTLGVMAVVIVTGSMGKWVFATQMRERLAEKDARLAEKEREITEQKAKNAAQERLIDRLSGVADRSTSMASTAVVHQVHERRHREDAA